MSFSEIVADKRTLVSLLLVIGITIISIVTIAMLIHGSWVEYKWDKLPEEEKERLAREHFLRNKL